MGKCLGEVPNRLACRADLLGIETNVIAIREQFFQEQACHIQTTGQGQILDVNVTGHDIHFSFADITAIQIQTGVVLDGDDTVVLDFSGGGKRLVALGLQQDTLEDTVAQAIG